MVADSFGYTVCTWMGPPRTRRARAGRGRQTRAGSGPGSPGMARMVAPGTDIDRGDTAGYHPVLP